jgi:hypothetical protein
VNEATRDSGVGAAVMNPPPPPLTSPDGRWWWDGYRWAALVPPPLAQPFIGPNGTSVVSIRTWQRTKRWWWTAGVATVLVPAVPLLLIPLEMFFNRVRHLAVYSELDGGYWTVLCHQYPDNPKAAKRLRLLPRQVAMQAEAPTCRRCLRAISPPAPPPE